MGAESTDDVGLQRILRDALRTELGVRLRHALLHSLKSPAQTILSALHLLEKKAQAGDTGNLQKYSVWIKDAVGELTARAELILPPKPAGEDSVQVCDLRLLTEDAIRLLRDEAALKEIEVAVASPAAVSLSGKQADLSLALQAILLGILDLSPQGSSVDVLIDQTADGTRWTAQARGSQKPGVEILQPQFAVQPPHSGIAWAVASAIVEEHRGTFGILDASPGGWKVQLAFPSSATAQDRV